MRQINPLTLLRGPLIILSVASALLAPYLAQLSTETLALFGLLILGLCVTLVDVCFCVSDQLRTTLNKQIEACWQHGYIRLGEIPLHPCCQPGLETSCTI